MSKPKEDPEKAFGQLLRDLRNEKGITLRKFAQMVDLSPTYVSKVERGEMNPPSEDTVKRIAHCLNVNVDELLAKAGKVASELTDIFLQKPRIYADFLRTTQTYTPEEMEKAMQSLRSKAGQKKNQKE